MGEEHSDRGKDLKELISSLEGVAKEAEGGSETERFLILLSWLNEELMKRGLGRVIIVGGFAAEIYSARAYRTGDVDIIVEGDVNFVREFLKAVSDVGLRIYLLKFPQFTEKGIDIVADRYEKQKKAVELKIRGRTLYIIPPEEVVVSSLAAWKFWNSLEDRDKAYLVYAAQKEHIDSEYMKKRAAEEGVEKELEEMIRFVTKEQSR
jgi:hypothetical protein